MYLQGTEFYDAPTKRYVDFPITDVLQMMGRAGRPQFDQHGVAVIMVGTRVLWNYTNPQDRRFFVVDVHKLQVLLERKAYGMVCI